MELCPTATTPAKATFLKKVFQALDEYLGGISPAKGEVAGFE